jgi:hypothetical protein
VILPAWFLIFSLGWSSIKNLKLKWSIIAALVVALAINFTFFKQYYTRLTKDQFRECSRFVINNNPGNFPVYAPDQLAWLFNYYFRNSPNKVMALSDRTSKGKWWLVQSHYSDEERGATLQELASEYTILERHSFFKADAVLLEHK